MTRSSTWVRQLGGLVLALTVMAGLAACAGHGTKNVHAAVAASSAMANPTVSADATQLENELLTAWKAHFSPAHPVKSSEAAIGQVFPHGNTDKTASYAVQQLSTAMIGSKPAAVAARRAWAQEVVMYALGPDGTASPVATFSPGPSQSTTGAGA
jgi:hypothetical protein